MGSHVRIQRTFVCEGCGKTVNGLFTPDQRFCSPTCYARHYRKQKRGNSSDEYLNKRKLRTLTCPVCGETKTDRFKKDQTYCSKECLHRRMQAESMRGKNGETVPCAVCGTPVYVIPHNKKAYGYHFCGLDCKNQWMRRDKIEYTCQVCGKTGWVNKNYERIHGFPRQFCSTRCANSRPGEQERRIAIVAAQNGMYPTSIEVIGYSILDELGIPYLRQHSINNHYIVDAFVPSRRTVVQFDGDYWHANPQHFTELNDAQRRNVKRDARHDKCMATLGYTVIRIWECDLRRNREDVKERLRTALR